MKMNKAMEEIREVITNKHLNGIDESDRHIKRVFALCMITGIFCTVLCIVGIYDMSIILDMIIFLKEKIM